MMLASDVPGALIEGIRQVANLIAAREWKTLRQVASSSRVAWIDVARVVYVYGRTFRSAPNTLDEFIDAVPVTPSGWSVSCPLWTEEEGRSDLAFHATCLEVYPGLWRIDVDDVLVP